MENNIESEKKYEISAEVSADLAFIQWNNCPLYYYQPYSEEYDDYVIYVDLLERLYCTIPDCQEFLDVEFRVFLYRPVVKLYSGVLKECTQKGKHGAFSCQQVGEAVPATRVTGYRVETKVEIVELERKYGPTYDSYPEEEVRDLLTAQGEMTSSEIDEFVERRKSIERDWEGPVGPERKSVVTVRKVQECTAVVQTESHEIDIEAIVRDTISNAYEFCKYSYPMEVLPVKTQYEESEDVPF